MFVILRPNSNTNPSEKYRVVRFGDWLRFRHGDISKYRTSVDCDTYAEAEEAQTRMNQV